MAEQELRGIFAIARQDRQCKDEGRVHDSLYPTPASTSWNIFFQLLNREECLKHVPDNTEKEGQKCEGLLFGI